MKSRGPGVGKGSPPAREYRNPHGPSNSIFAKSHAPIALEQEKVTPTTAGDGFRKPSPKKLGGGMSFKSRARHLRIAPLDSESSNVNLISIVHLILQNAF